MQNGMIRQWGKSWQLKYRLDVIVDGVKKRKDVYKRLAPIDRDHPPKPDGSAPEKVKALAVLELAPLNAGLRIAHSGDTVQNFLESFLTKGEGGSGRRLNPTTQTSYKNMYNILKPLAPNLELRQIRTPHIDKWLRDVAIADGADLRAQTSYSNLKGFLSSAFRYALRHGLIESNPVRDTAIPQGNPADTHAYSLAEVRKIMQVVTNPTARAAFMVCMFTGLRVEELKGLKWEDYREGLLHVNRAVVAGKIVDVKTHASKAPVPVVKTLAKVLAAHLKLNSGDGYIFHGDTGKPVVFENLARRVVVPELKKADVEWHGFHAFRRGLASYLETELGIPRDRVKRILRHSTDDVTGRHYIKANIKESRQALQKVEAAYLKTKCPQSTRSTANPEE